MDPHTASKLNSLMQATVAKGSARKSFRKFRRGELEHALVGGKTGSLTGFHPRGRYDWFVGFGQLGDRKIAYAALCINKEKWYVKSARLARELLEFYLPYTDQEKNT
jgi:membrane peptidoglycan carboxypeptidase